MESVELNVVARAGLGSGSSKSLRTNGFIPAVIYSGGSEATSFAINEQHYHRTMTAAASAQVFTFVSDDKSLNGLKGVRKVEQLEPIKSRVLHVDFVKVEPGKRVAVTVPIVVEGEVESVKKGLSFIQQTTYEVQIECLPKDIPNLVKLDVTGLADGQTKQAGELKLGEGVTLRSSSKTIVASIESKSRKAVEAATEAAAAADAEPAAASAE